MKVCILGDLHFGCKKNNDLFLDSHVRFIVKQLIPYLKEHNIDTIIQLGDFFDNRTHINVKVMNKVYELLANELKDFKIYVLVGNHDLYYKTTTETHSLQMFKQFPNVEVIDKLQVVKFDKTNILLTPWLIDYDKFLQELSTNNYDCDVCCGHFELNGFKMNSKVKSHVGMGCDILFNNYKLILSGHFHTRSRKKRNKSIIEYVGSMSHLTRSDIGDKRGFSILDTDTLDLEFVENKLSLKYINVKYPQKVTRSMVKGNIVDVEVDIDKDFNEDDFQFYLKRIEEFKPAFPPIPNYNSNMFVNEDDLNIESMTITEIIKEYIETIEIENKNDVYSKIQDLYEECKGES